MMTGTSRTLYFRQWWEFPKADRKSLWQCNTGPKTQHIAKNSNGTLLCGQEPQTSIYIILGCMHAKCKIDADQKIYI